jgi:hypothetical protein
LEIKGDEGLDVKVVVKDIFILRGCSYCMAIFDENQNPDLRSLRSPYNMNPFCLKLGVSAFPIRTARFGVGRHFEKDQKF